MRAVIACFCVIGVFTLASWMAYNTGYSKGKKSADGELSTLRERADRLATLVVRDGENRITATSPTADDAVFYSNHMWYAPFPILTVNEWAESGLVGEGRSPRTAQWSCPPGYTLKWDGTIPYCEVE